MLIRRRLIVSTTAILLSFSLGSFADNPIVQTIFTADPAPMVFQDTLFCYSSHDADKLEENFFTMKDWRCFSTTDMVNWQHRGEVASLKSFSWAGTKGAWAPQCIHWKGKFYMYCPLHMKGIGVLVSDTPIGPFTDPLKKPLIKENGGEIDPTAFVDDDGQAYLYWGNPNCRYVKLNQDMISYTGNINQLTLTAASFGARTNTERPSSYEEGPWLYKRNSTYYLAFAGGPISEHLAYSTSNSPTGPWTYGGIIMPAKGSAVISRSFTIHPGIIDYKGNTYLFYHNQALSVTQGFQRSVCIEQFTYKSDGSIPAINMTKNGPDQIGSFNPYDTVQAETICFGQGIETNPCSEGGIMVDSINSNDYIKLKGVDFKDGAKTFSARVASGGSGGKIELRLGSQTGTLVGTCEITGTGGWDKWTTKTCNITGATGKKDLFLKFTGSTGFLFNFNWWKFSPINTDVEYGVKQSTQQQCDFSFSLIKKTVHLRHVSPLKNVTVELYSVSGRLIATLFQGTPDQSDLSMDLASIRSGSYLIKVVSDKSVITKTINLM